MRQIMAEILMLEDDRGRLATLRDRARRREDISIHLTGSAIEVSDIVDAAIARGKPIEVFLLDVRVPKYTEDKDPTKLPANGATVARDLYLDSRTSSVPVVVYTKYADHPDISEELADLEARYPNVVEIHRCVPSISTTLKSGLTGIHQLDATVRRDPDNKAVFELTPHASVGTKRIVEGTILMNGLGPVDLWGKGPSLFARFSEDCLYGGERDYLMIKTKDTRKTIFCV